MATLSGQSYGQALPDQVERISFVFDAHLQLVADVRELYRERAALEKEYAAKLQVLARKAAEKKAKMDVSFIVGDEPTKTWDINTLRKNSLNLAYEEIMSSLNNSAQDHINFSDALASQVLDELKIVEKRNEDAKKKQLLFFQKLLAERDRIYADRTKSKQKYDEECTEVEAYRAKQTRAQDDRHAERASKQAEQQRNDMLNSKNVYIISTSIANSVKSKFYTEDLPTLEDEFQTLQTRLTRHFVKIMHHAQDLQSTHLDNLKSRVASLDSKLRDVDPSKDQDQFIEHNVRTFAAPTDWKFEECPIHYDTDAMSTESVAKVFIQNKLSRCRAKLQELGPLIDAKRRELEQLSRQVNSESADYLLGTVYDASDAYLEAQHQLASYASSERILNAEIDTIVAAIGDDEGAGRPHSFKSSSFSIPTQCNYCKSSIWGLTKQGKTCKACGISVHSKCELKVPADCQHADSDLSSTVSRKSTTGSRSSAIAMGPAMAATPSSFANSIGPGKSPQETLESARVIFDFNSTSEFELAVSEGSIVRILEPDDGSGWVKVLNASGDSGLIPATYLAEMNEDSGPSEDSQRVRAIYPYQARGSDELGLHEGELLTLTSGPSGGINYGGGWWEGVNSQGRQGIFPSNYVELL